MDKLHLYFDAHLNGYCVDAGRPEGVDDLSFTLGLIRDWDAKNRPEWRFKRIVHTMGDWQEMLTKEEMAERVRDVADHEGEEIANIWNSYQEGLTVGSKREFERFAAVEKRFLAFVELGLELPIVHGEQFRNPTASMGPEGERLIAAAREREMEAAMAEANDPGARDGMGNRTGNGVEG